MSRLTKPFALLLLATPTLAFAEETGSLEVTSSVEGAAVYLDYEQVGVTPLELTVPVGRHSLRISADGHNPWTTRVNISASEPEVVEAELFPGGGTVEFMVEPAGAAVQIDGQNAGTAPIRLTEMPAGEHTWTLSAPLHESATGTFEYQAGRNILVVEELQSSRGLFEITSRPEGAEVSLNGEFVGTTPLSLNDVDPGQHQVLISLEDYGTVFREVDTSDGSKGEVSATLMEDPATLRIKSGVADAEIYVENQLVSNDGRLSIGLNRGTYEVRVEADGMATASRSVRVPRSGKVNYRANLAEEGGRSNLEMVQPLTSRWTFWAALGTGGVAIGVTSAVVAEAMAPEPPPSGEVEVLLP